MNILVSAQSVKDEEHLIQARFSEPEVRPTEFLMMSALQGSKCPDLFKAEPSFSLH